LKREQRVLSSVPHRRASRREHGREGKRKEGPRGIAREVEITAHQHATGFAEQQDGCAFTIRVHPERPGIGPHELIVAKDEVGTTRNPIRVIGVHRNLNAERLAVFARIRGPCCVRGDEQRCRTRAPHEPQRAFAERWSVDQEIPAFAVVDDVLALVFERFVQLEDPRAELMNVHGADLS